MVKANDAVSRLNDLFVTLPDGTHQRKLCAALTKAPFLDPKSVIPSLALLPELVTLYVWLNARAAGSVTELEARDLTMAALFVRLSASRPDEAERARALYRSVCGRWNKQLSLRV